MTIDNGQVADADEVMNAIGSNFNDTAQNIFNADYIGFDSRLANFGSPVYKNIGYSTFTSDVMTKLNTGYMASTDTYIGPYQDDGDMTTVDEFNDSSVDATLWTEVTSGTTTSTITEDTEDIKLNQSYNTSSNLNGVSKITLDGSGSNKIIDFNNGIRIQTGGEECTVVSGAINIFGDATVTITDGSNTKIIYTNELDQSNTGTLTKNPVTIDAYIVDDTLFYAVDGIWATHDITSWTQPDITIEMMASSNNNDDGSGYYWFKIDWVRYNSTSPTASVESVVTTSASTITNAIPVVNSIGATPSIFLSANNGSNYELATEVNIHRFSNTGTQSKLKASWTGNTPFVISEYAYKYNLY